MDRQEVIGAIGYNVRVVCGFPGIGKTRAASKERVFDLDLRNVPEKDQIEAIRAKISEGMVVLVPTWAYLRKEMRMRGIEYAIVYPPQSMKEEYMEKVRSRGRGRMRKSAHAAYIEQNYLHMAKSCLFDPTPYHVCLESIDENLADFL